MILEDSLFKSKFIKILEDSSGFLLKPVNGLCKGAQAPVFLNPGLNVNFQIPSLRMKM